MIHLSTDEAKLLYMCHKMKTKKDISFKDSQLLKHMIINNRDSLLKCIRNYKQDGTQLTLQNEILMCIKQEKDNETSSSDSSPKRSLHIITNL